MKATDSEDLVVLLDMLSARGADGKVTLPSYAADALMTILNSLPGPANRVRRGPSALEYRVMMDACGDKPHEAMAREIARQTGQKWTTVRRRLQEIRQEIRKRGRIKPKLVRAK